MNPPEHKHGTLKDDEIEEVPVCLNCFEPVEPTHHYCPHCGRTTGQLTPYIPFLNIAWQAEVWGKMWRQIGSREVSLLGKLVRIFMVIWFMPVLLIGLLFRSSREALPQQDSADEFYEEETEI